MSEERIQDTGGAGCRHTESRVVRDILSDAPEGVANKGRGFEQKSNATSCNISSFTDGRSIMGLIELGRTLYNRFDDVGHLADINNAIRCFRLAILLASSVHAVMPTLFTILGMSYVGRFEGNADLSDLNKAIRSYSRAILLMPDGHADKPGQLRDLGNLYLSHFKRTGNLADVDKATQNYDQALLLTPDEHTNRLVLLNNLGDAYTGRFARVGELVDVRNAIHYHGKAVLLTPDDHVDKPQLLSRLGHLCLAQYKLTGDPADIDKTIDYRSQVISLTHDDHSGKPGWLDDLGNSYMRRFERVGQLSDIDKAIEYQVEAVLLTPDGHKDRPLRLHSLGVSYKRRFERNGELGDVNKAIHYHAQAVQPSPGGLVDRPGWLSSLGSAYNRRFEHNGELADLNKAIEYHTQAVILTPDGHADKPRWLSNLGTSYLAQFQQLGEVADIDKAIHYQDQSVLLTPDSHSDKAGLLNNLGMSYGCRFERLVELTDADKGIECHRQAVFLTPEGHADKPNWFSNLGNAYMRRFIHHGKLPDIFMAIHCHTQAVLLAPDGHAVKNLWLNGLGSSHLLRFEIVNGLEDVEKAIACLSQAARLTPDGHAVKSRLLNNLAKSYRARFMLNAELADINESISFLSQAVLLTPDGHADKPGLLDNLGLSYQSRFHCLGKSSDIKAANKSFERAAQLTTGDPQIQFKAARHWSESSHLLGRSPQPAYHRIMELMPELVWLGSTIGQRYNLVIQIGDVAMEAASSAISFNEISRALEWLEQGRSIVWNQILQLRTPFNDLSAADSGLANRLKEVGRELEYAGARSAAPFSLSNNTLDLEQDSQYHRRLAAEWGQLLNQARLLPGFHNFMRPRRAKELMYAAKDGPVVVINLHSSRCDALIILPNINYIAHVPLENFSLEKAAGARADLLTVIADRGARSGGFKRIRSAPMPNKTLAPMLSSLWSDVVKPVLDFLGYTQKKPIDELPRVTWCTTGALSFLPLHAAGCYDGSQPNAFDLVVSSYTPTLTALLAPTPATSQPHSGILAVGQEYTTGMTSLPYTVQELAAIRELAKEVRYSQLTDENATVDAVISAMDKYSWVHLACHASQNTADPSQSAFHMHDGNLFLSEITKRSFKNKGLAFLSACQTATGDEKLPDEAVHLAAGMLMAGYPSVIATMWAINDEDAPEVARRVYTELLQDGKMDHTRASRALHKAVAGLREKIGEDEFNQWVPFIHIGS